MGLILALLGSALPGWGMSKSQFRTNSKGVWFLFMKHLSQQAVWPFHKKKTSSADTKLAFVGMTGFEPATPSSRTKYATGLRYIPKWVNKVWVWVC